MVAECSLMLGHLVVGGFPNVKSHLDGVIGGFNEALLYQSLQLDVLVVTPTLPLVET